MEQAGTVLQTFFVFEMIFAKKLGPCPRGSSATPTTVLTVKTNSCKYLVMSYRYARANYVEGQCTTVHTYTVYSKLTGR